MLKVNLNSKVLECKGKYFFLKSPTNSHKSPLFLLKIIPLFYCNQIKLNYL